jgi:hypothetical protein
VGAQPAHEQRLRRHDDTGLGLDILAVGAVLTSFLSGLPNIGVELQAIEHAKSFTPPL